jgi:hypothetical protein
MAIKTKAKPTTDFYVSHSIQPSEIATLQDCATKIIKLKDQVVEDLIEIGNQLLRAKAILGDHVTFKSKPGVKAARGTFVLWAKEYVCAPLNISYDTASRWMKIAEEVRQYPDQRSDILCMLPTALYETVRPSFPSDLKAAVYNSAANNTPLSAEQIKVVKQLHQTVVAQEQELSIEAIVTLSQSTKPLPTTTIKNLSRLEATEQNDFAQKLVANPSLGRQQLDDRLTELKLIEQSNTYSGTPFKRRQLKVITTTLNKVAAKSQDFMIVECPFGAAWKDSELGLRHVANKLEEILAPGGMAMIFLGHTTILSAATYLTNLVPLSLLTVRRQPGNSTTNIGINMGYASAHAMLVYQPPFKATPHVVFDLQTFDDSEDVGILGEVPTGIEDGICKFLDTLVPAQAKVGHLVIGNRNYQIRPHLIIKLQELKAQSLLLL